MTQCNIPKVKLSNSELNKSKSAAKKYSATVILRLSSNIISDDRNKFPHELLFTEGKF